MKKIFDNKWYALLVSVAVLAVIAVMLLVRDSDTLFRMQEMNLFLYTPLFFKQQMVVAGGLLTYLGTYFTQYFYHPALGTLLLTLWGALTVWLAKRAFRIPDSWILWCLLPFVFIVITIVDMGYWMFYLKLRGHCFVALMGTSAALAIIWGFRCLRGRYLRLAAILVMVIAGYPLIGAYALLAAAASVVLCCATEGKKADKIIIAVAGVAAMLLVPVAYYNFVYHETNFDMIYRAALPLYEVRHVHTKYYLPYFALAVFFIVSALLCGRYKTPKKAWMWATAQLALVVVAAVCLDKAWYDDVNFHKELQMQACLDNNDTYGILNVARDHESDVEPTRMIVMFKDIALFRNGKAADEMFRYRNGAKQPKAPFHVTLVVVGGANMYLQWGRPNFCNRWCMENGVEYGWRAEYLKTMTKCALVNGEYKVAQKYLDILRQTKYHGEWADKYQKYVGNKKTVEESEEFGQIVKLMDRPNLLTSDNGFMEGYLMRDFISYMPTNTTSAEAGVLWALKSKDIRSFWQQFFNYAELCKADPEKHGMTMPIHFQEAAYLYGTLEHKVDISHMPFKEEVKKTYDAMMTQSRQFLNLPDEKIAELLYPMYGGTFFYDYFFLKNLKTY